MPNCNRSRLFASVLIGKLLLAKFYKRYIQQSYVPKTVCVPHLRFQSLSLSENPLIWLAEFGLYAWWTNCH